MLRQTKRNKPLKKAAQKKKHDSRGVTFKKRAGSAAVVRNA
jgi:hypothetical protein